MYLPTLITFQKFFERFSSRANIVSLRKLDRKNIHKYVFFSPIDPLVRLHVLKQMEINEAVSKWDVDRVRTS